MKLAALVSIKTGIFAQPKAQGEVAYLQARHFDNGGGLESSLLPDLPALPAVQKHLLQEGDVLFAAKGVRNFASLYQKEWGKCVASSTFLVLQPYTHGNTVLMPEFLCWWLNQPNVMQEIQKEAMGTALPLVSKSILQDLELSLPSLFKQKQLLKLISLYQKEQHLQTLLQSYKQQLFNHYTKSFLNP